jgi:hypothetical protein
VRDGVGLVLMVGKLGDEAAAAWEQHFAWLIGRGQVRLFIDAEAVTMPGTAFISTGTKLIGDIRPRIEELQVLVGGGLVEMVAKTVNLTLGGLLQLTRDRAQFEAALNRARGS